MPDRTTGSRTLILTGATGNLGSVFLRLVQASYAQIVSFGRTSPQLPAPNAHFTLDLSSKTVESLTLTELESSQLDVALIAGVDDRSSLATLGQDAAEHCIRVNCTSQMSLLKRLLAIDDSLRCVYISTSLVVERGPNSGAYTASKACAESYLQSYQEEFPRASFVSIRAPYLGVDMGTLDAGNQLPKLVGDSSYLSATSRTLASSFGRRGVVSFQEGVR